MKLASPTHVRSRTVTLAACLIGLVVALGCRPEDLRFRAIYVDLDGTALGHGGIVRPATIEALHAFQRAGGHVGIATGRTREQANDAILAIRPDLPVVLANGSEIIEAKTGRLLDRRRLPAETARDVLGLLAHRDSVLGVIVHFERANIADHPERLAEFATRFHLTLAPQDIGAIDLGDTTAHGGILKLLVVAALVRDTTSSDCPCREGASTLPERVRNEIAAAIPGVTVVASGLQTIEVVPRSKGDAVLRALRLAKIDPADVIAFGDSGNDVEMLKSVGFGVAMGNCGSGACESASARIGSHDTDAIADMVRRVVMVHRGSSERSATRR